MEQPMLITLDAEKAAMRRRSKRIHHIKKMMERDGCDCFFCGQPLGDDVTIEHLLAVARGGPGCLSNLALAHQDCNYRARNLSVAEKVRLREEMRNEQREIAA